METSMSEGSSSHQDALWQLNLRSRKSMESGPYPIREGEPDCSYYIRTGLCRFGSTCRFNHPPNRKLVLAATSIKGEYPERIGQSDCQYYLKTGTCKFGAACKFHHPEEKAGIAGRVALNVLGYPLRANDAECTYYMRTGQCKFGSTCKFHHPQTSNMMVSLRGSLVYPPTASATTPGQLTYPLSRASFFSATCWQDHSSYAPLLVPQGAVTVPGFSYNGQVGSASSFEGQQQQRAGNNLVYGSSRSSEKATMGWEGMNSSYHVAPLPLGYYAIQRENVFPERVGQPECQFYMKTGDCKFGAVCRFHHPRERLSPPDCLLSPVGLPLRSGEPLCIFYSRYGICKFGPNCKFDHPMGISTYSISASSSIDSPSIRHLLGSSSETNALKVASEGILEAASLKPRQLSLSETRKISPGDNNID